MSLKGSTKNFRQGGGWMGEAYPGINSPVCFLRTKLKIAILLIHRFSELDGLLHEVFTASNLKK